MLLNKYITSIFYFVDRSTVSAESTSAMSMTVNDTAFLAATSRPTSTSLLDTTVFTSENSTGMHNAHKQ